MKSTLTDIYFIQWWKFTVLAQQAKCDSKLLDPCRLYKLDNFGVGFPSYQAFQMTYWNDIYCGYNIFTLRLCAKGKLQALFLSAQLVFFYIAPAKVPEEENTSLSSLN